MKNLSVLNISMVQDPYLKTIFWVFTEPALNVMLVKLSHHPKQEAAPPPPHCTAGIFTFIIWNRTSVYFYFYKNVKKQRKILVG
jgi:hypothetical protein